MQTAKWWEDDWARGFGIIVIGWFVAVTAAAAILILFSGLIYTLLG